MTWTERMLAECQYRIGRGGEDFDGLKQLLRIRDYLWRRRGRK